MKIPTIRTKVSIIYNGIARIFFEGGIAKILGRDRLFYKKS